MWIRILTILLLVSIFRLQGSGQQENCKIQLPKKRENVLALLTFNSPVKRVDFYVQLESQNELDTLAWFKGFAKTDSARIVTISLNKGYGIWTDERGTSHPFGYKGEQLPTNSILAKKAGNWLVQVRTDSLERSYSFKQKRFIKFRKENDLNIKKGLDSLGLNYTGSANMELEFGNSLYENNNQPNHVSRLYGQNALNIRGLPMGFSYQISSAHSSFNNLNYFRFELDRDALIEQLKQKAINASMKRLDSLKAMSEQTTDELQRIENKYQDNRSKYEGLMDTSAIRDSALTRFENSIQKPATDTAAALYDSAQNEITSKAQPYLEKYERLKREELELMKRKDELIRKQDTLQQMMERANSLLHQVTNKAQNPDSILSKQAGEFKLSGLETRLMKLNHLKIGKQVIKQGNLIGDIPVNGFAIGFDNRIGSVDMTIGTLHQSQRYHRLFYVDTSLLHRKRLTHVNWTIPIQNGSFCIGWMGIFNKNREAANRHIANLRGNWTYKIFKLNGELVSDYLSLNGIKAGRQSFLMGQSALSLNAQANLFKEVAQLELGYRNYGDQFQPIGYRRLPLGLEESNLGLRIKLLENRINLKTFYSFSDQPFPAGSSVATTKWGGTMDLNVCKGLQAGLAYLPITTYSKLSSDSSSQYQVASDFFDAHAQTNLKIGSATISSFAAFQIFQSTPSQKTQSLMSTTSMMFQKLGTLQYTWSNQSSMGFSESLGISSHVLGYTFPFAKLLRASITGEYISEPDKMTRGLGTMVVYTFKHYTFQTDVRYRFSSQAENSTPRVYGRLGITIQY